LRTLRRITLSYKAMRSKVASKATGTGKSTPTSEAKVPKIKGESVIERSFKAGPKDGLGVKAAKMGKSEG
jgi:hypothetical protein